MPGASEFSQVIFAPNAARTERVVEQLASRVPLEGRSVLDVGCGQGNLLWMLVRDHGVWPAVGIDLSPRNVERAVAAVRLGENTTPEFLCQDALDFRPVRPFDVVVAEGTLQWIEAPLETKLARLRALGAKDGWVVFSWGRAAWRNRGRRVAKRIIAPLTRPPLGGPLAVAGAALVRGRVPVGKFESSFVYLRARESPGLSPDEVARAAPRCGLHLEAFEHLPSYHWLSFDSWLFFLRAV